MKKLKNLSSYHGSLIQHPDPRVGRRDITNSRLITLQSVFNLSASVDRIAPILKENQQLHDADDVQEVKQMHVKVNMTGTFFVLIGKAIQNTDFDISFFRFFYYANQISDCHTTATEKW